MKAATLERFHGHMQTWRAEGLSFDEIAVRLQSAGVAANKGKVYRYFKKVGLPTDEVQLSGAVDGPPPARALSNPPREEEALSPTLFDGRAGPSDALAEFGAYPVAMPEPESPPVVAVPPEEPLSTCFPELERNRDAVDALLDAGVSTECIQILLKQYRGVDTALPQLREYILRVLEERFPPGPLPRELFEIKPTEPIWPNEKPILTLEGPGEPAVWTLADCNQSFFVAGSPGVGKTTATGVNLATLLLQNQCGGVVLMTKQSDAEMWATLATACGRDQDLVFMEPGGSVRCNLLQYESERPGADRDFTQNYVAFMRNIVSAVAGYRGTRPGDEFWARAGDQLLSNAFKLILRSGEPLTLKTICDLIMHSPQGPAQARQEVWPRLPVFGELMQKARQSAVASADMTEQKRLESYWLHAFPNLPEETRSCITFSFSATVDALLDKPIYEQIASYTNSCRSPSSTERSSC